MNPVISPHDHYLKFYSSNRERMQATEVFTFGLVESSLAQLSFEKRALRFLPVSLVDRDDLEDVTDHAFLASPGHYVLPRAHFHAHTYRYSSVSSSPLCSLGPSIRLVCRRVHRQPACSD